MGDRLEQIRMSMYHSFSHDLVPSKDVLHYANFYRISQQSVIDPVSKMHEVLIHAADVLTNGGKNAGPLC